MGDRRSLRGVIESWKAGVRAPAPSDRSVAATEAKGAAIVPVMVTRLVEPRLLGRDREREVLERLLEGARAGHGGVLVLHGDPGVGKTALLEFAVENGRDFRVVRTAGAEGEMELPYAALQQLCSPIIGLADRLPDPQRNALAVAFGRTVGPAPDPFLVGLAVLGLLSEEAEARARSSLRRWAKRPR